MSNPLPSESALKRMTTGQPIEALEQSRDELAEVMIDFEAALDDAERREQRVADRRRRTAERAASRFTGGVR